ncbi:MAG TPA: hypothetical protein VGI43_13530 [Mucilaginibacter sp.]
MNYRFLIFIMFCFCLALNAAGQQTFILKGVVSKKLSGERIAQVVINNLRSKELMMSDELGWFSIKAAVGDTLLFTKIDYTDQKIVITGRADIPIYMQPVIKLATVTIQGQTKKQELNDIMNDYRKLGTFYDGKPPVLSFISSPITGLYELFGKTPGEARRFKAYTKDEIEYAEVHRRYNAGLIVRVTNTTDSTAKKFMAYYTPSYQDLKGWNDYELIKRVKREFKYFEENRQNLNLHEHDLAPVVGQN